MSMQTTNDPEFYASFTTMKRALTANLAEVAKFLFSSVLTYLIISFLQRLILKIVFQIPTIYHDLVIKLDSVYEQLKEVYLKDTQEHSFFKHTVNYSLRDRAKMIRSFFKKRVNINKYLSNNKFFYFYGKPHIPQNFENNLYNNALACLNLDLEPQDYISKRDIFTPQEIYNELLKVTNHSIMPRAWFAGEHTKYCHCSIHNYYLPQCVCDVNEIIDIFKRASWDENCYQKMCYAAIVELQTNYLGSAILSNDWNQMYVFILEEFLHQHYKFILERELSLRELPFYNDLLFEHDIILDNADRIKQKYENKTDYYYPQGVFTFSRPSFIWMRSEPQLRSQPRFTTQNAYEDQMYRAKYTPEQLEILNSLVENEKDRKICKRILEKAEITSFDVLNYKLPSVRQFIENCDNYGIKLDCTIIGKDQRVELIKAVKELKIEVKDKFNVKDYIVQDWVKIDKFILAVNKLSKGEQHRACKQLISELNDKWLSTFYHNTNNDCRALIKKFHYLNIESSIKTMSKFEKKLKYFHKVLGDNQSTREFLHRYEDQMFTTWNQFKTTMTNINNTAENINTTYPQFMNKMNSVADKCDLLTTKMLSFIENFNDTMNCATIFLSLMKFVSFSYLISQQHNRAPSNVAALIALILPTGVGNSEIISSLSRAVLGIIRNYNVETTEQGDDHQDAFSIGGSLFSVIKCIVKSSFTTIDDKAYSSMRVNTYFIKTIADFLKSCSTIVDFFVKAISTTMEFIMNHIMEYYGCLPTFLKDGDFEKVIDDFLQCKKHDYFQNCGEDINAARKVIELRNRVNEIEGTINKAILKDKSLIFKISPYIRVMATQLDKAYDDIPPQFKEDVTSHRIKPFFVFISGPPRIGKSKIFQPIVVNELAKRLKFITEYQDPQHYCCFRTAGREFWDGGQGKKVIWYNDLFQAVMNENELDLALEEIGSVVDDNPYHMNMADVKDKSRHYLTAPVVVANAQEDTTNAGWLNQRTWSHGEHLARRRDINCILNIRAKYKKPDGTLDLNKVDREMRAHPDRCYGKPGFEMFPSDLYKVAFLDVKTGVQFSECEFEQAVEYICDEAERYFARQDILTTRLRENMKLSWEDQMYHDSDSESDEAVEHFVRPARRNRLEYNPTPRTRRELFLQESTEASRNRLVERMHREQELYRPRRAKIYTETTTEDGEVYYECHEDVYPEDTNRVYDGSTTGSIFTYTLSTMACHAITHYLTSLLLVPMTDAFVAGSDAIIPPGYLNSLFRGTKKDKHLILGALAELAGCGMKITAMWKLHQTMYLHAHPYVAWIVQSLFAKGIHRSFKTIEDIIIFGFQNPEYYYENFVDFVYNTRDSVIHSFYQCTDHMIASYYTCLEIYERMTINNLTNYLSTFKDSAMQAFHQSFRDFKEKMNSIPGWIYFAAGVTIFGATAYLLYRHFSKNNTEEHSHEGNMKAKRRRIARKLGKKTKVHNVQEHAYDTTNREIERIIRTSYCHIGLEVEVDGTWIKCPIQGMALNLKGNLFVMPYHYWYRFEHCNKMYSQNQLNSRLAITWSLKEQSCVYFDAVEVCSLDYEHTADVTYFRIKKFNCGRDITHFFVSENDNPILSDSYLFGYRPRGAPDFTTTEIIQVGKITTIEKEYQTSESRDVIFGNIIPSETIHYDYCYHYTDCKTGPGDCTMVLMHTDPKVNGKILGIHTAGNRHYETGIAAPIYREDIEEVVAYFSQSEPIIALEIDTEIVDYKTPLSTKAQPYVEQGFNVLGNTGYMEINGKKRRICSSFPTANKVQPSIVYERMEEDFGPSTVLPSALCRGKDSNGNLISPFFEGFKKLNNYTKNIPHKLHIDIVEHCAQTIKSWPSQWNKQNARLLTWDECINGYMNLKGLDLTTSSGFPYTMTCPGKKHWFEKQGDKWVMGKILMDDVLAMEEKLKKGIVPPIYFIDTLKDETRPIEKVKQFKTRIFQVGSMSWTILFRKYFGWFMGHCQSTHEFGEMMSGINPTGYDWDLIARKMLSISRLNDNGDYAKYDSTLSHQACTGMSDAANYFYENCEDDNLEQSNLVRHGLILGSINRNHIVEDFVVYLKQGNPSGFLLTTIINNFCNMYYNRYAFVKLTGMPLNEFKKYIYCIFFGDDKNATIHPAIQHQFNMETYQKVMAELGLEYTSASKKEIIEPLIDINDITFLKRRFVYDTQMHIWKSQLDHTVIMEIPRWSESDPANTDDQMNRFNSCLKELANYGEQEFQLVRDKFRGYILELNTKGYNFNLDQLFTFQYCMYLMYPKHYPTSVPVYDLAVFGQQQTTVLRNQTGERSLHKPLKYTEDNFDGHIFEEQSNVANSTNSFKFTKSEMVVLKKRVSKTIRKNIQRIRPILRRTADEIAKVAISTCPCPGAAQIYGIVSEMVQTGELWQLIQEEDLQEQLTPIDESVEPQGMDDDGPQQTIPEKETTSTFLDVNEMHVARPLPNVGVIGRTTQDGVNLAEFINRPYIVSQTVWNSTNTLYSNYLTLEFPYVLTSVTSISNKLQNIAYWEPDIEITIRANTTIFHYGALCFNWIPQAKNLSSSYKSAQSCLNSKNWTQLIAGARQPLRFVVPYTHYKNKITLGKEVVGSSLAREDLFTLFGYVSWPLSSAQAATVAPVNVSVFARFVNPRANGYILDAFVPQGSQDSINAYKDQQELAMLQQVEEQMTMIDDDDDLTSRGSFKVGESDVANSQMTALERQIAREEHGEITMYPRNLDDILYAVNENPPQPKQNRSRNPQFRLHYETPLERTYLAKKRQPKYRDQIGDGEAIANTKSGIISNTLLNVADFVGKFVPIPFVGSIASPISAITATTGYFAKWMGFSIPHSVETPSPMQIRQPHLQKTDDTPLSVPLCPNNGLTAKDFAYVNSYPNEMSIAEYVGTPGLIYTGRITPTQVPGDIVFRRAISPDEFIYGDWNTPMPGSTTANAYYNAWPTYTKIASLFAAGWRGSFKFDVNFFCTQFHSCRIAAVYQLYQMGALPTDPTTTNYTNAVNLTMDIQSGTNFSFIIPMDQVSEFLNLNVSQQRANPKTLTRVENNGYLTFMLLNELSSVIATPIDIGFQVFITPCEDFQLIGTPTGSLNATARGHVYPQGIDDTEACDYPASSVTCLRETKPIMLSSNVKGYRVSGIHHPFEITSMKQLINMLTPLCNSTYPMPGGLTWTPYGITTPLWTGFYLNYLTTIQSLYRYSRGGFRLALVTSDSIATGFSASSITTYQGPTDSPIVPMYNIAAISNTDGSFAYQSLVTSQFNGFGTYISNLLSRSPLDVVIPWYYNYKCFPNAGVTVGTSAATRRTTMPTASVPIGTIYSAGTAGATWYFCAAGADDFLCGWTLPAPLLRYNVGATPGSNDVMPRSIEDDGGNEDDEVQKRVKITPTLKDEMEQELEQEKQNELEKQKQALQQQHVQEQSQNQSQNQRQEQKPPEVNIDSVNDLMGGSTKPSVGTNQSANQAAENRMQGRRSQRTKGPPPNRSKRSVNTPTTESGDTDSEEIERLLKAAVY